MRITLIFILIVLLLSCGDIFAPRKDIPGPYYLKETDDATWTLYYELDDAGIGRVESVKKAGWTDKYLLAQGANGYYFIEKEKDDPFLNSADITQGPFPDSALPRLLDSLKISSFQFQINLR